MNLYCWWSSIDRQCTVDHIDHDGAYVECLMEAASIQTCQAGPLPSPDIDMDIPDLVDDSNNEDEELYVGEDALKDGDCIFTVMIPCEAEFRWATSNVSQ